jgi:hypothetical protein
VLEEAKDERDAETVDAGAGVGSCTETPFCSLGSMARQINLGGTPNTNFQQPYYQMHAYGLGGHLIPRTYGPRSNISMVPQEGMPTGMSIA